MKLHSVAARTTLAIGALAVLAFALAAWLITRSVGSVQEASARRELAALAHREAEAVGRSLENHMAQVRGMAAAAEVEAGLPRPSRERLRQLVERNIARDAEALGYWFEMAPDGFDGRDREFLGSRDGGYADTKGRVSIILCPRQRWGGAAAARQRRRRRAGGRATTPRRATATAR
ncbi:MAG: hypothetical protein KatS3mg128_1243 [Silanimonas sp.]|nr:MAG: hypothetical protein KatS3mg128_1243 [Silanimonas sp.]